MRRSWSWRTISSASMRWLVSYSSTRLTVISPVTASMLSKWWTSASIETVPRTKWSSWTSRCPSKTGLRRQGTFVASWRSKSKSQARLAARPLSLNPLSVYWLRAAPVKWRRRHSRSAWTKSSPSLSSNMAFNSCSSRPNYSMTEVCLYYHLPKQLLLFKF